MTDLENKIYENAEKLVLLLKEKKAKLTTAESCTAGMIAASITDIAGASEVFECGFVTYSNESKNILISVPVETIEKHGAVSSQTAISMAEGALKKAETANISIAVTGIAGPGGGTPEKPVGLVYIASSVKDGKTVFKKFNFAGNRKQVRLSTVNEAFKMVISSLLPEAS